MITHTSFVIVDNHYSQAFSGEKYTDHTFSVIHLPVSLSSANRWFLVQLKDLFPKNIQIQSPERHAGKVRRMQQASGGTRNKRNTGAYPKYAVQRCSWGNWALAKGGKHNDWLRQSGFTVLLMV